MNEVLTPVESSNIAAVGHTDGTLTVQFKSGAIYDYADVPSEVFEEFVSADSVGRYFNQNLVGRYGAVKREVEDDS